MGTFYTNCQAGRNKILLRGYRDGKRVKERIPYRPHFFLPCSAGTYQTLNGETVSKIEFDDIKTARNFYDQNKETREIYGMERFAYAYIHENYPEKIEYDPSLIRVGYLDIEVDAKGGFPNVQDPQNSVTAITIILNDRTFTLGLREYINDDPNVRYMECKDETHLLDIFIQLWRKLDLDVVSGWNIETFDIPYLVNRITKLLGVDEARRLSPWSVLQMRRIFMMGKQHEIFLPLGISVLDYLHLYTKFAYTRTGQDSFKESKRLDYIANKELGEKKIDWHEEYSSLDDLYQRNHQLFIDYNIHDAKLVQNLNGRLKFIELVYAIAYDAHVNYADAMTSVLLWDVICYNHLMRKNIVVPKQEKRTVERAITGARVKEPQLGMHEWVVSFDLTSLYPSLIMGYNISPETFITKIDDFDTIEELLILKKSLSHMGESIAANGNAYRKDIHGFLPELMELHFAQRASYKSKMQEAKRRGDEETANDYYAMQLAKKIQINALYGSLSNPAFRFFDQSHAEAITLSGQLAIMWAEKAINKYLNDMLGETATRYRDFVIASDTDSLYLDLSPFIKKINPADPISFLDKLCRERLEPKIAEAYEELAKYTNAYQNKMKMNREVIADRAIWQAKKRYIVNVWDLEGDRYETPKLKIIGIEAVRSSTPELSRTGIIDALQIIMSKDEETLKSFIKDFKEEFYQRPFEEVAFPTGVNNMDKYSDESSVYKKHAPMHVKASLFYNKLIREKNLGNKYEKIYSGAKIKYCHLIMPNPVKVPVIASIGELPREFELDDFIDRDMQFEKSFAEPLRRITNAINWQIEDIDTIEDFF